jgi:xylulokinase
MSRRLFLGHDLGSSKDRAVLVAEDGRTVGSGSAGYPTESPHPGWFEQDPLRWWDAVCTATRAALADAGAAPAEVAAVAFTGQMQGTIPVDERGRPLWPCITWMDTRAAAQAAQLTRGLVRVFGYGPLRLARWLWLTSGAPSLTGSDAISKIAWLRQNQPDVWRRTARVLDAKDYLLWRATGHFATTADCANLTWLMDTRPGRRGWSTALLDLAGLSAGILPEIVPSTAARPLTAEAARELGLEPETKVVAGAGDVFAMAIGSGAVRLGVVHMALGTGSWVAAHVDRRGVDATSYVASMCSAHPTRYAVVASQQTAGESLEWVRREVLADGHGPLAHDELQALAAGAQPGAGGVMFLPWLCGERTPIDDARARGGFANLALRHGKAEMARAVYEGVAHNTRWALGRVERLVGREARDGVRFGAGGARSPLWCQVLADVLDRPVLPIAQPELGAARGAALLAAHAVGHIPEFDGLEGFASFAGRYEPRPALRARYDQDHAAFCDYYRRNRSWFAERSRAGVDA